MKVVTLFVFAYLQGKRNGRTPQEIAQMAYVHGRSTEERKNCEGDSWQTGDESRKSERPDEKRKWQMHLKANRRMEH